MNVTTTFVTHWVANLQETTDWFGTFFGRRPDADRMPNCREWYLPGVVFQVIEDPERTGERSLAFATSDLDGDIARLRGSRVPVSDPRDVAGFEALRYVEVTDPEGISTGLLNADAVHTP